MKFSTIHKNTYDALAEEYEGRANTLREVIEEAISAFAAYIRPGGTVLDIGCGVGVATNVLIEKGFKVTGIEISPKMAEFARRRNPGTDIIVGDFLETTLDRAFDAVLAFAFIHLFPKKETPRIFDQMKSVLKPHGVALICSTESPVSKEGWFVKDDYEKKEKRFRKFWTENELADAIEKAGFRKIALNKYTDPFGKVWLDFVAQKN